MDAHIKQAAQWIKNSRHTTVFTGAGISVESGIPPFRGENGIYNKYDPAMLEIDYFRRHPNKCWPLIKEIFYDFLGQAKPNDAHKQVARLEQTGYVKAVITQNIDNLHQEAGSRTVFEFHGTCRTLSCVMCRKVYKAEEISFIPMPPRCSGCNGLLKPNFVFFGEAIPREANALSFAEAQLADVFLVIGTTGEVMPACMIPIQARDNGAKVIEINTEPSTFTYSITDVFLRGKASEMMNALVRKIEEA
ncbi:MAG: SIR2 family NAD-dependent protein deacylase [Candidatus Omnitrophota bacterium]